MNWDQTIGGVTTGAVALTIGWWTYKRGHKGDVATVKLAEQTEGRADRIQAIQELESVIKALKDSNANLVDEATRRDGRLDTLETRLDLVATEVATLKRENHILRRRLGENGTTPPSGTPVT